MSVVHCSPLAPKSLVATGLWCTLLAPVGAQSPDVLWARQFGEQSNVFGRGVVADGSGVISQILGVLGPGSQQSTHVRRVSPSGALLGSVERDLASPDVIAETTILPAPDGDFYLGGWLRRLQFGTEEMYVGRVDPQAGLLWSSSIDAPSDDRGYALASTGDSGAYFGGRIGGGVGSSLGDALVAGFDDQGNEIWRRVLAGAYAHAARRTWADLHGSSPRVVRAARARARRYRARRGRLACCRLARRCPALQRYDGAGGAEVRRRDDARADATMDAATGAGDADAVLLERFECQAIPAAEWDHRHHLAACVAMLRAHAPAVAFEVAAVRGLTGGGASVAASRRDRRATGRSASALVRRAWPCGETARAARDSDPPLARASVGVFGRVGTGVASA